MLALPTRDVAWACGGETLFGQVFDIAIIGGGINGTAIARDAAGRGLSVFLCEAGDLAGGSSSATTKVAHGSLRCLRGLEASALREVLTEREILMRAAPHLVQPLRFVAPHNGRQWPRWVLSLGLLARDRLVTSMLPPRRCIDLRIEEGYGALRPHFAVGYAYSDCVADDSRLVIVNAIDARMRGASINPQLRCVVAERDGRRWRLALESTMTGDRSTVTARVLVNATGSQAGAVIDHVIHTNRRVPVRLTKECSIVVRRRHDDDDDGAYALPTADGRIVYAMPYERDLMLIGASSGEHRDDPSAATVEPGDVAYLLNVAGGYFHPAPRTTDIAWSFAAVRAMPQEAGAAGREEAIVVDAPPHLAPVISLFGGALTTHRRLAERVLAAVGRFGRIRGPWTAGATLPGGGLPRGGVGALAGMLRGDHPFLSESHAMRLACTYGTRAQAILSGARTSDDLGAQFAADLTESEVRYLRDEEWAFTADDILWRRSKLGLVFTAGEAQALAAWLAAVPQPMAVAV